MRIAFLVLLLAVTTAQAQVTHYQVKLTPDIDHQLLIGEESIEFLHSPGDVDWQKQPALHVSKIRSRDGEATVSDASVSVRLHTRAFSV